MDEKCEFKLLPCNASEKAVLGLVIIYRQKGGGGEFHDKIYLISPKPLKYSSDPPKLTVNFLYSVSDD